METPPVYRKEGVVGGGCSPYLLHPAGERLLLLPTAGVRLHPAGTNKGYYGPPQGPAEHNTNPPAQHCTIFARARAIDGQYCGAITHKK